MRKRAHSRDTGWHDAKCQSGCEQHAGKARRHREANVVGTLGHEQDQGAFGIDMTAVELTGGVAGDNQVVDLAQTLPGKLRGRHALWAVAGAGERDQQRRAVFGKPLAGVRDDVGGRDGFDASPEISAQGRGEDLPGKGRRSGAGQDDANAVLAVREAVGVDVVLRVDANQGWDAEQAVRIIRFWEDHEVNLEFVEQPVAARSLDDLALVTRHVQTPVLADESVWTMHDLNELLARHGADLINVKLAKTGGITEALRMIGAATTHGIGVVIGCMMESHVGIAAAAAIASRLATVDGARAQDLDAGLWLRSSPVVGGALYRNDVVVPAGDPGLGIRGIAR